VPTHRFPEKLCPVCGTKMRPHLTRGVYVCDERDETTASLPAIPCPSCKTGTMGWVRSCGALVCFKCDHHDGLCRCYCGWSASGWDGARELVEMGENLDEEG
jgi:hypothetical protein